MATTVQPLPSTALAPLPAASLFDLRGRVVIVTGASAGIGRMLAVGLAGEGAHVVMAARRADALRELEAALDGSLAVPCDMRDDGQRAALIDAALARFGRIDGLVNNAGISGSGQPASRQSVAELRDVLEVDLVAPFDLATR